MAVGRMLYYSLLDSVGWHPLVLPLVDPKLVRCWVGEDRIAGSSHSPWRMISAPRAQTIFVCRDQNWGLVRWL